LPDSFLGLTALFPAAFPLAVFGLTVLFLTAFPLADLSLTAFLPVSASIEAGPWLTENYKSSP
jgi:hypothetical protein